MHPFFTDSSDVTEGMLETRMNFINIEHSHLGQCEDEVKSKNTCGRMLFFGVFFFFQLLWPTDSYFKDHITNDIASICFILIAFTLCTSINGTFTFIWDFHHFPFSSSWKYWCVPGGSRGGIQVKWNKVTGKVGNGIDWGAGSVFVFFVFKGQIASGGGEAFSGNGSLKSFRELWLSPGFRLSFKVLGLRESLILRKSFIGWVGSLLRIGLSLVGRWNTTVICTCALGCERIAKLSIVDRILKYIPNSMELES